MAWSAAAVPVTAYSTTDLRVPELLARRALAEVGAVTSAWLDCRPVLVSVRADGGLAVSR